MKVLVLTINYAPEPTGFAPHVSDLCTHLGSMGEQVVVVTGFPFAPQWRRWQEYRGRFMGREVAGNVQVVRVTHFIPRRPRSALQRLLMEGTFCLSALAAILALGFAKPDLILYVGAQPSVAMLARVLSHVWRRPYVVAINDLATQAAADVGIVRARWMTKALERFEYAAYRRASGAIVLCPSFQEVLTGRGYPGNQVRVIPSPVDLERIRPVEGGDGFRGANGFSHGDFLVMYAGSMGVKQGLSNVVEAARLLKSSEPRVKWVLVGEGELRKQVEESVRSNALTSQVVLLPLQPEDRVAGTLGAADLLLLNQLAAVKDAVIPSKLLTYMAAGKGVVAAVNPDSQGARVLREANGGMLVAPENPQALADAILHLSERPEVLKDMGRRNRQYAEQHFDRRLILVAQESFLREVVKSAALS